MATTRTNANNTNNPVKLSGQQILIRSVCCFIPLLLLAPLIVDIFVGWVLDFLGQPITPYGNDVYVPGFIFMAPLLLVIHHYKKHQIRIFFLSLIPFTIFLLLGFILMTSVQGYDMNWPKLLFTHALMLPFFLLFGLAMLRWLSKEENQCQ